MRPGKSKPVKLRVFCMLYHIVCEESRVKRILLLVVKTEESRVKKNSPTILCTELLKHFLGFTRQKYNVSILRFTDTSLAKIWRTVTL